MTVSLTQYPILYVPQALSLVPKFDLLNLGLGHQESADTAKATLTSVLAYHFWFQAFFFFNPFCYSFPYLSASSMIHLIIDFTTLSFSVFCTRRISLHIQSTILSEMEVQSFFIKNMSLRHKSYKVGNFFSSWFSVLQTHVFSFLLYFFMFVQNVSGEIPSLTCIVAILNESSVRIVIITLNNEMITQDNFKLGGNKGYGRTDQPH